jgi:aryl-alcohol dehydrogenase-like predicted oxidoreductase
MMDHRPDLNIIEQRLGLGCARLGSVLGVRGPKAATLLATALEGGIRFFDTASIYGQGDSERILGQALHGVRQRVMVVSKAGQYFPRRTYFAKPFKAVLSPLIRRSGLGRQIVAKAREAALPQDFSPSFLRTSTEGSLRRLKFDHLDILLLHSPPPDVIERGDAVHFLETLRDEGKTRMIGISCDDIDCGLLALRDRRIQVLELPLWPWTERSDEFVDGAVRQGVYVIARGLIGAALGVAPPGGLDRAQLLRGIVRSSLALSGISRLIIGTTRIEHLKEILAALQRREGSTCT